MRQRISSLAKEQLFSNVGTCPMEFCLCGSQITTQIYCAETSILDFLSYFRTSSQQSRTETPYYRLVTLSILLTERSKERSSEWKEKRMCIKEMNINHTISVLLSASEGRHGKDSCWLRLWQPR